MTIRSDFEPALWRDFFVMVGGGAAALTGLVFVAMSLNLKAVTQDATHRNRAIGTLTGFTYAFILCGMALMGVQNNLTIGIEWLALSVIATFVYIRGYVLAVREGGSAPGLSLFRTLFGSACYIAQIAGSILLMLGYGIGIYIAAGGMMLLFSSLVSGAWLLLVGICNEKEAGGGSGRGCVT
ncbi:MAG TPA: hypothetical protein VKT78_14815 [Fimbriimonadaceae bacterium]|nr:hypothetical protein [Fimbriimonadaceae bacterium]